MRWLKSITTLILLITTPSLLASPRSSPVQSAQHLPTQDDYFFSYDEIMQLLAKAEDPDFEAKCSPDEAEALVQFFTYLAKQGQLEDNSVASLSLDSDINALLGSAHCKARSLQDPFAFCSQNHRQSLTSILNGKGPKPIICGGWLNKKVRHVRRFVKKHKKAIIVGAIIVVAAAVVVVAVAATTTAAGAGAGAAAAAGGLADKPQPTASKPTFDEKVADFKDHILQNDYFALPNKEELSWEETGRAVGSIFAHESYQQSSTTPYEFESLRSLYLTERSLLSGHPEIDRKFSTEYSYHFVQEPVNFSALSHQARGESALSHGYYKQAVQEFGEAIRINPSNPVPYLERGTSHFKMGEYSRSVEDFRLFKDRSPRDALALAQFAGGFAKKLPQGVYQSGGDMLLFLSDFVRRPVQTSGQMVDALTTLAKLVHSAEWGVISETLAPEVSDLVINWEHLSPLERGERAGYAFGKHGTDFVAPGAAMKLALKSAKAAQELAVICKNLEQTQKILVLETAARMGSREVAEVMSKSYRMSFLADELGYSGAQIGQLKQTGKLETLTSHYEHLSPSMRASFDLHEKAFIALKPYSKTRMTEAAARELIHNTGISTFPRPKGIPEDFVVMISSKGAGMEYVHPTNNHTRIRVMPGKPHSANPCQQKPYIIYQKDGKILDKFGNVVEREAIEAHIPLEEFINKG